MNTITNNISIEKYQNIIKGAYVRSNNFIKKNPSNRLKKLKKYL